MVVLRKGAEWQVTYQEGTVYWLVEFHRIAREHGSKAQWLPVTGTLVTLDRDEQARNLPYDQWREEALRIACEKSPPKRT